MDRELVCGDKFVFGHETISLLVSFKDLPNKTIFEGNTLLVNDFLHVSLVCIGKIIEKYNVQIEDFKDKIIKDFCEFSSKNEIGPVSYSNDFKFGEKEDKKTIVVMCNVPNLNKFFDQMNKKYRLDVEYPPTHATLYKLPNKLGIFLTDLNDIKNFTKPITNPIGHAL
ncbi:MAG: hypothetical protein NT161_01985 [Candidatus Nomurabacteria bacterium]|nr:hypothetical protein [Candidatus Nomurabacteria bacterium]